MYQLLVKCFENSLPVKSKYKCHNYYLVIDKRKIKPQIFSQWKMGQYEFKEYYYGNIPKLNVPWAQAIKLKLEYRYNTLWLIIEPKIWIEDETFDSNTLNLTYKIFKTMVFAIVAEELIFRESISDVIKNKWVFILVSASVYTLINFAFVGFSSKTIVLDILSYFLPALLFSYAYTKYNNNIILLMLIKFTYQLVPLTLLLIKS